MITSGYNGGAWTGSGITSSTAAARVTTGPLTALGYADDGAGNVTIQYTLAGDANPDGIVNGVDLAAVGSHYNRYVTNGWASGDFNYDGVVNGADLAIVAENYNDSIGTTPDGMIGGNSLSNKFAPLLAFAASVGDLPAIQTIVDEREGIAVPEPGCFGVLAISASALLGRRRR